MSEEIHKPGGMRRFRMDRDGNMIAQGCQFGDGTIVIRWFTGIPNTGIYNSLAEFKKIHVEDHATTSLRWEDKCCFACGTGLWHENDRWCSACGAMWEGEGSDEPEPEKGQWLRAGTLSVTDKPT